MSERDSQLSTRELFVDQENRAFINDQLKLRGKNQLSRAWLGRWFDDYLKKHDMRLWGVENLITVRDMMTDTLLSEYRGAHYLHCGEVPYHPALEGKGLPMNKEMIHQGSKYGKFPKFMIKSAVEDMPNMDGQPVVRNVHDPVRISLKPGLWRFGRAVPAYQQWIQRKGMRLVDKEDLGSLHTFELLGRKHTPRDMSIYMTNGEGSWGGAQNIPTEAAGLPGAWGWRAGEVHTPYSWPGQPAYQGYPMPPTPEATPVSSYQFDSLATPIYTSAASGQYANAASYIDYETAGI